MPEVTVTIGSRSFEVSCQAGEEHYLRSAAAMLDAEASAVNSQIGRMPEARMLLMAGLMLADKTAGMEEQLREREVQMSALQSELQELRSKPAPEAKRVEVPVVPEELMETLAELAARAEAMAADLEEKAGA